MLALLKNKMVSSGLSKVAGNLALTGKYFAPEFTMVLGMLCGGAAMVVACIETHKAELVVTKVREDMKSVAEALEEVPEKYSQQQATRDNTVILTTAAVDLVKIYAIPIGLSVASVALIVGGHTILRRRNAAITAAYMGLSEAFKEYKKRVETAVGPEQERMIRHGVTVEEKTTVDDTGVETTEVIHRVPEDPTSPYARYFDKTNPNWTRSPETCYMFLRYVERNATDKLRANGHLFLNEVYDMLSMPRTNAGQHVGWVSGRGDDCVDLDLPGVDSPAYNDFIKGYTSTIILDFNVDGEILYIFTRIFGESVAEKLIQHDEYRSVQSRLADARKRKVRKD